MAGIWALVTAHCEGRDYGAAAGIQPRVALRLRRGILPPELATESCDRDLLRAGVDPVAIGRWLGHADLPASSICSEADLKTERAAVNQGKPSFHPLSRRHSVAAAVSSLRWKGSGGARHPANRNCKTLDPGRIRGSAIYPDVTKTSTVNGGRGAARISTTRQRIPSLREGSGVDTAARLSARPPSSSGA